MSAAAPTRDRRLRLAQPFCSANKTGEKCEYSFAHLICTKNIDGGHIRYMLSPSRRAMAATPGRLLWLVVLPKAQRVEFCNLQAEQ